MWLTRGTSLRLVMKLLCSKPKTIFPHIFLDGDKKNQNLVKAQVIDKDFYANFKSQVADDTILDKLTQMNSDILQLTLQVENKMFTDYNNMRKDTSSSELRRRGSRDFSASVTIRFSFLMWFWNTPRIITAGKIKENRVDQEIEGEPRKKWIIYQEIWRVLKIWKKLNWMKLCAQKSKKVLLDIYYKFDVRMEKQLH